MQRPRAVHRLERVLARLGTLAVPLLGRQLCTADPPRRDAARDALAAIAGHGAVQRARVVAELRAITSGHGPDDAKVVALGLLSELGEHADARFADPRAIRVRSAIALAAHLETAADVAGAADMMVRELGAEDIGEMLEVMAQAAPRAAHLLAGELAIRLDLPGDARDRVQLALAALAVPGRIEPPPCEPADQTRQVRAPVEVAVLVDASRTVVIAATRTADERRWRRWAVLIGASGRIDDCLHEDDAGPDGPAPLVAALCAEGYRLAEAEADHQTRRARDLVAAAARLTAESTRVLPSAYYLGRDLLELGDAHVSARRASEASQAALARATELISAGEHARALPLLAHVDPDNPDAAAALAACLLATGRPASALAALDRAIAAEPDWPLHHWNRGVALHQLGDRRGSYHALRRFVAASAARTGLYGDPDQPARVGCALRLIAELERTARLTGVPLGRRPAGRARAAGTPGRSDRRR